MVRFIYLCLSLVLTFSAIAEHTDTKSLQTEESWKFKLNPLTWGDGRITRPAPRIHPRHAELMKMLDSTIKQLKLSANYPTGTDTKAAVMHVDKNKNFNRMTGTYMDIILWLKGKKFNPSDYRVAEDNLRLLLEYVSAIHKISQRKTTRPVDPKDIKREAAAMILENYKNHHKFKLSSPLPQNGWGEDTNFSSRLSKIGTKEKDRRAALTGSKPLPPNVKVAIEEYRILTAMAEFEAFSKQILSGK